MAKLMYGDIPVKLNFHGNRMLAVLQVATSRRFATGKGYFITVAGTNDDGGKVSTSHWISPGAPLRFDYDVEQDTGDHVATVMVEEDDVNALLDVMDRPIGVVLGYFPEAGSYVPFIDAATRAAAAAAAAKAESAPQPESGRGTDSQI